MRFKVLLGIFILAFTLGWAQGEWVVQDNPFNGNESIVFSDVHAVDSLHVWVIGYNTGGGLWVLRTSDGGKDWSAQLIPYFNTCSSQIMLNWVRGPAIKFVDLLHGYFVWGPWVYHTTNGGNSWVQIATIENGVEPLTDIEFVDTLKGWSVDNPYTSKRGCIYHTSDGGQTWGIQDSCSAVGGGLLGICFLDSLKGYVVGQSGTLMGTTDGGKHWTKVETGTTKDLMDNQFADSLHGIAVGLYGVILSTGYGGEIWTVESSGTDAHLFDVAYPDISHTWATGMFFSDDKGKTWEYVEPPVSVNLYAVSFSDSLHGWCVGDWGRIIHFGPKAGIEESSYKQQITNYRLETLPNPFSQTTAISLQIAKHSFIAVKIYDAQGSLIKSLLNESKPAGVYKIYWDGKNGSGQKIPPGIYFCQLEINGQPVGREKLVLMH